MKRLASTLVMVILPTILMAPLLIGQGPQNDLARILVFGQSNIGFGARALAMGGAFTALADDVTAMSYNPAGLAQLIKPELAAGARLGGLLIRNPGLSTSSEFWSSVQVNGYTSRMISPGFEFVGMAVPFRLANLPIVLGLAYQNKVSNVLKMEFTRYASYSGALSFPGREGSDMEEIAIGNNGSVNIATLSLALRPVEFLFLGANVNAHRMDMTDHWIIEEEIRYFDQDSTISNWSGVYDGTSIYTTSWDLSYDVGFLLKLNVFSLGAVYKTGWHTAVNKSDKFSRYINDNGSITTEDGAADYAGELYWPYSVSVGLALRPIGPLTLSFDYNFARWSEGRFDWDPADEDLPPGFPVDNPQDTQLLRAGIEYLAFVKNIAIPLRIGGFRDRLISLDDSADSVNFWGASFGTGIAARNVVLDIAAVYHFGSFGQLPWLGVVTKPDLLTTVKSSDWRISASLAFRFGGS